MEFKFFKNRFSILIAFCLGFFALSTILRLVFIVWEANEVSLTVSNLIKTLAMGLFFDLGTASLFFMPLCLYLTFIPKKIIGSKVDKVMLHFIAALLLLILVFTFFAEITFWEEFKTRFNFIAVDYLIYTNEVISNIQQSYPLPLLFSIVLSICFLLYLALTKVQAFKISFQSKTSFKIRILYFVANSAIALFFIQCVTNQQAEWSENRYNSEISKAGIYSFFAAFKNNQLDYATFYNTIPNQQAFTIVQKELNLLDPKANSIKREVINSNQTENKPNVILIMMESMSASFMAEFGSTAGITPNLDTLAQKGILFNNLMATGNRTVRGIEALTLSIPPTPGQSIVKRPNNQNLITIGTVFKNKGYQNNFFYGGDGYFDNMNSYFSGNGFAIFDRGRGGILNEKLSTKRTLITDDQVSFENAWGICDEDIFNVVLQQSDSMYSNNQPFFNYILTTSNHRPYTYPENKIDIPSGTGREGAVKYADFAIGAFIKNAQTKPWFKNTVFVIVADHCASSAGKNEIDVQNYHIPAIIYNLPNQEPVKESKLMSQIDLLPTLFGKLNWNYNSNFYGQDVNQAAYKEKALMATYRKLGYMNQNNEVVILSDQKKNATFIWDKKTNNLISNPENKALTKQAISWYQTADYLFSNQLLKAN
ncbi:sulfatase-like hydrolase/transferase [Flavobacterium agricola]|uniref:Sulfatase-like hydrolase/transferase n=1 Tax=Flavobacterium agricola TaxID=2870839 RepID=A0ABY6LXT4_9FLAO|nr:alkaline phosphatase family protein [Flavobacterium agricola]UYW01145.1 sulfatase-like hydrolase/transferase [Flavobacterium agricola]